MDIDAELRGFYPLTSTNIDNYRDRVGGVRKQFFDTLSAKLMAQDDTMQKLHNDIRLSQLQIKQTEDSLSIQTEMSRQLQREYEKKDAEVQDLSKQLQSDMMTGGAYGQRMRQELLKASSERDAYQTKIGELEENILRLTQDLQSESVRRQELENVKNVLRDEVHSNVVIMNDYVNSNFAPMHRLDSESDAGSDAGSPEDEWLNAPSPTRSSIRPQITNLVPNLVEENLRDERREAVRPIARQVINDAIYKNFSG